MSISDPIQLNEHYNDLFRKGDIEALLAHYEPRAVLSPAPGQQLQGHGQIREQLKMLLTLQGELTATQKSCLVLGQVALLHASWKFKGKDGGGNTIEMGGHSSKLARKGADGSWRNAKDMPAANVD